MPGIPHDPVVRHLRAKKAGAAAGRAYRRMALERVRGCDAVTAYQRGYGNGYRRAYVYWQHWGRKLLAQEKGIRRAL